MSKNKKSLFKKREVLQVLWQYNDGDINFDDRMVYMIRLRPEDLKKVV